MTTANKYEYFFPILQGESFAKGFHLKGLLGTAFAINERIFITAGHCLPEIFDNQISIGIVSNSDSHYRSYPVKRYEIIEEIDLGIIETASDCEVKSICWSSKRAHDATKISASGYAYGLDIKNKSLYNRTFTGYTVASKQNFRLKDKKLKLYELSFICPKGLSGAPVIDESKGVIIGVILGNTKYEIELGSFKEQIKSKEETKTYITTETMKLGEASQVHTLLDHYSELLEMTIGEFLNQENKLV